MGALGSATGRPRPRFTGASGESEISTADKAARVAEVIGEEGVGRSRSDIVGFGDGMVREIGRRVVRSSGRAGGVALRQTRVEQFRVQDDYSTRQRVVGSVASESAPSDTSWGARTSRALRAPTGSRAYSRAGVLLFTYITAKIPFYSR